MKWTPTSRGNIEDRRGMGGPMRAGMPLGIGGLLVVLVLSWATGTDFLSLIGGDGSAPVGVPADSSPSSPTDQAALFVDNVAADNQEVWTRLLGQRYEQTRVVLFRDVVQSACGMAQSATGPFYCPGDHRVYLDLGFFDELDQRFGAPGDFAQAYVIAHEFGHHVQNLLGTNERVQRDRRSGPESASVALELQADCYAGVWGRAASQPGRYEQGKVELEPGDVEEGLRAAAAIGDDRLQKMSTGRVSPESFTHGSSQQRVEWFRRGMQTGDPRSCDTFAALGQ
jgi:predicted metalloprotease